MSTATEISRLITARNKIRDKMIELGLGISTDKLDILANEVDSITNRGSITATVQEGDTYTIPAGYHNGSGTVSGVAGGGNYSLQSKTITPTKNQQSVTPDNGYYGLSDVTVYAIPEAYQNVTSVTASAGDVLANKIIVDSAGIVTAGTMTNNGAVSKVLDATNGNQSYAVPTGYHNGSGTVSIVLETKNATPSTVAQNITPTNGKVLSKVVIAAIPSNFGNVTGDTATASDLLSGKKAHTLSGGAAVQITGTMVDRGTVTKTLDVNTTSYTIPSGKHSGSGTVSIALESKNVTPTESAQTITPTSGKVISAVSINAIPSNYVGSNIAQNSSGDLIISGATVTAPSGYYAAAASKTIPSGSAKTPATSITANPAISISASGLITATASATKSITPTVSVGYITAGTAGTATVSGSSTSQLDTQTAVTITPSTVQQTVGGAGKFMTGAITVSSIPSAYQDITGVTAVASHVLASDIFVDSTGSAITGTMATLSTNDVGFDQWALDTVWSDEYHNAYEYVLPSGFNSTQKKFYMDLGIVSVTPTTSSQIINKSSAEEGSCDGLEQVTVNAIPAKYGDTSTDTAVASHLLSGYKAHTKSGSSAVQITGTMANNGAVTGSIDGLTTTSFAIPSGYTSGGTISLTNDIETALAAI